MGRGHFIVGKFDTTVDYGVADNKVSSPPLTGTNTGLPITYVTNREVATLVENEVADAVTDSEKYGIMTKLAGDPIKVFPPADNVSTSERLAIAGKSYIEVPKDAVILSVIVNSVSLVCDEDGTKNNEYFLTTEGATFTTVNLVLNPDYIIDDQDEVTIKYK